VPAKAPPAPPAPFPQAPDLAFRALPPPPFPEHDFEPGAVRSFVLDRGARVFAYARSGELTSVRLSFALPPALATGQTRAVTQILGPTMNDATLTFSQDALQSLLLAAQSKITVNMGSDDVSFELLCPNDELDVGLKILGEVARNPRLDESNFEYRKALQIPYLNTRATRPADLLYETHEALLFGATHPYGAAASETAADVAKITRADLLAALSVLRDPRRMTIAVVGSFDATHLKAALEADFGAIAPGAAAKAGPAPRPTPPPASRRSAFVDRPGAATVRVRVGSALPYLGGEDDYAGLVLEHVLGDRVLGRLHDRVVVERAITDDIDTSFVNRPAGSELVVSAQGPAARAVELVKAIESTFADVIRDGVHDDELRAARDAVVWQEAGSFERVSGVAYAIVALAGRGDDPDARLRSYGDRIRGVTATEVRDLAARFLSAEKLALVVLGDGATVREPLVRAGYLDAH
jgi:zinc protease